MNYYWVPVNDHDICNQWMLSYTHNQKGGEFMHKDLNHTTYKYLYRALLHRDSIESVHHVCAVINDLSNN